jgi:hypothetical protein
VPFGSSVCQVTCDFNKVYTFTVTDHVPGEHMSTLFVLLPHKQHKTDGHLV